MKAIYGPVFAFGLLATHAQADVCKAIAELGLVPDSISIDNSEHRKYLASYYEQFSSRNGGGGGSISIPIKQGTLGLSGSGQKTVIDGLRDAKIVEDMNLIDTQSFINATKLGIAAEAAACEAARRGLCARFTPDLDTKTVNVYVKWIPFDARSINWISFNQSVNIKRCGEEFEPLYQRILKKAFNINTKIEIGALDALNITCEAQDTSKASKIVVNADFDELPAPFDFDVSNTIQAAGVLPCHSVTPPGTIGKDKDDKWPSYLVDNSQFGPSPHHRPGHLLDFKIPEIDQTIAVTSLNRQYAEIRVGTDMANRKTSVMTVGMSETFHFGAKAVRITLVEIDESEGRPDLPAHWARFRWEVCS